MAKDFSEDLLIQKFNKADADPIFPDHDLIVMSDEAHRTQNGVFADNLMHMLLTANRIGFTGTPLLRDDNITARTFGQCTLSNKSAQLQI